MTTKRNVPEHGNLTERVYYIREAEENGRVADPNYQLFSDNLLEFNWSPEGNKHRHDGLGFAHATAHYNGNESHEVTITYDLQNPLVDSSGNAVDPMYEAIVRNADQQVDSSFHVLQYDERVSPSVSDPAGCVGARLFTVATGGKPNVECECDPEEGKPIPVELEMLFDKVRSYLFHQPGFDTLLCVSSTHSDDTDVDITLETKDGETSETLSLDGENLVSTGVEFSDLMGAYLSDEAIGDVNIYLNEGTEEAPEAGSALTATPIRGALHYSNDSNPLEGDLGVPVIGEGSLPEAIGLEYEHFQSARVDWGDEPLGPVLTNLTVESDNSYDEHASRGLSYLHVEENAETTVEATVIGPEASHGYIMGSLASDPRPLEIEFGKSLIRFNRAEPIEGSERNREADGAVAAVDVTFEPSGDRDNPAIEVINVE